MRCSSYSAQKTQIKTTLSTSSIPKPTTTYTPPAPICTITIDQTVYKGSADDPKIPARDGLGPAARVQVTDVKANVLGSLGWDNPAGNKAVTSKWDGAITVPKNKLPYDFHITFVSQLVGDDHKDCTYTPDAKLSKPKCGGVAWFFEPWPIQIDAGDHHWNSLASGKDSNKKAYFDPASLKWDRVVHIDNGAPEASDWPYEAVSNLRIHI